MPPTLLATTGSHRGVADASSSDCFPHRGPGWAPAGFHLPRDVAGSPTSVRLPHLGSGRWGLPRFSAGDLLMARKLKRVMAQVGMVMNLDKCIGCHTCSVTCKQAWTNRAGTEYVWFNNVETRPGLGYPRRYEDQEKLAAAAGCARSRAASSCVVAGASRSCSASSPRPSSPNSDDYYEPWTYDYQNLISAPLGDDFPVAKPKSLITGEDTKITWSRELGRLPRRRLRDRRDRPDRGQAARSRPTSRSGSSTRRASWFFLPRICEHCLNPSCMASLPVRRDLQAGRGRHRARRTRDRCRGWRQCITGCPYKKMYFNHRSGKAEKCTFCYPRIEVGLPTVCSETCVGPAALPGDHPVRPGRRDSPRPRWTEKDLYAAQMDLILDPRDPEVDRRWPEGRRHARRLDRCRAALPDLRADQALQGGAAAAPGVPDDADGLVHPAAVAGGRPAQGRRATTRRPPGNLFGAIDALRIPVELPRRAVHRR